MTPPPVPAESGHGTSPSPTVGWLELFYDLVFVAAIVTFSDAVSLDPDHHTILAVFAAFAAVWWIWLASTFFSNRFRDDDAVHRALVLGQMVLLTMTALAVGDGIDFHEGLLSITYGLLIADVALMYARTAMRGGQLAQFARERRNEYALATIPMLAAVFVWGPARFVLWGIAIFTIVFPALNYRFGSRAGEVGIDESHLVERLGLLTIIVCGESFVKVSLLAADGSLEDLDLLVLSALFILVFSMWWSYFDDVPMAGLPTSPRRLRGWLLGHLLLQTFLVGIAVGYAKLLPLDFGDQIHGDTVLLACGPLIGVYLSLALVGACTRRTPVGPLLVLRLGTAAVVALAGVAIWRVDWIDVESGAVLLAVIALTHGGLAAQLRNGTHIAPAPSDLR